jgi:murein DD-endopeptidase MepM/ murein hydrolase activator NlpD
VDGSHAVVRPYVAPSSDYGAGHRGIDLISGTELRAPADGVVHFAGVVVDRGVLSIDHGGGVLSSYEPVTTTLEAGDIVHRGEVIGEIQPGHCAHLCLHLGVRVDGEYVSPLNYLGGVPRAVLLPTRPLPPGTPP